MNEPFLELKNELSSIFMEREDVIEGMILGLLTGQHVLLLGPPGTAKSLLAREVCGHISNSLYFERLLTKFSVPEELFGPISLSSLEHDKYIRVTTNKLPEAHIAFLDEIFKASSSILNTLLTLINERLFHNDGQVQNVPLIFMVGASNELPKEESLTALYDRFLLRFIVKYINQEDSFKNMLRLAKANTRKTIIACETLKNAQAEVSKIIINDEIVETLLKIRSSLNEMSISDRRWRESLSLVKAQTFLNGRTEALREDMFVLRNCLWDSPNDIPKIASVLSQVLFPERTKILDLYDAAVDAYKAFGSTESNKKLQAGMEYGKKIKDAIGQLNNLVTPASVKGFKESKIKELNQLLQNVLTSSVTS